MLILNIVHPLKWSKLIDRWKLDTVNAMERITHTLDNISITNFIVNLLRVTERDLLSSWKLKFSIKYQSMIKIAENPYNVTCQVRQVILRTNPCRGDTLLQDATAKDLERLQCQQNGLVLFEEGRYDVEK